MILRHSQYGLAGVVECGERGKNLRVRFDFNEFQNFGGKTKEQESMGADVRVCATHPGGGA